ncbi:MAG: hypothetical protein HZB53_03640 [Chloroflexi bacterium]|nr:hypothetical protein [Chloroflexota bacterium]
MTTRILYGLFALLLMAALLLVTLQYFLSPPYLELEYEYAGFPPVRAISRDDRYVASQALLSYLNVEQGGASLLTLEELQFDGRPFFSPGDLACIFRAKELRGYAFALTFVSGAAAIALGLFLAAGDFNRMRRHVMFSAFVAILLFTALSLMAQYAFGQLSAYLLSLAAGGACVPAETAGLPIIFPPAIFRDGVALLALFSRGLALIIIVLAWLFGFVARRLSPATTA